MSNSAAASKILADPRPSRDLIETLEALPSDSLWAQLCDHPSEMVRLKLCNILMKNELYESLQPFCSDPNGHVRKLAIKFHFGIFVDQQSKSKIIFHIYPTDEQIHLRKYILQEEFDIFLKDIFNQALTEPLDYTSDNEITMTQGELIARSLQDRIMDPLPEPTRKFYARIHQHITNILSHPSGFILEGNL
ncbi:MAG: hypothetical protein IPO40_18910 [Fibrobacteres bacterium]|nr:hypothetical protein [Fibrobacterota bacterium]